MPLGFPRVRFRRFALSGLICLLPVLPTATLQAQRPIADSARFLAAQGDSADALNTRDARVWAIGRYSAAADLYRGVDEAALSRVLQRQGRARFMLGEVDSALAAFRSALAIETAAGNVKDQAGMVANIANILGQTGQVDSAQVYLALAITLAGQLDNPGFLAALVYTRGALQYDQAQYDSAEVSLRFALTQGQALKDLRLQAASGGLLVRLLEATGRLDSALAYGRATLVVANERGDPNSLAVVQQTLGNLFRNLGEPDSALTYFHQSLDIRTRAGDRFGEGRTLGSIATLLKDFGEWDSSRVYTRRSLALLRETRDSAGIAQILGTLAMIEQETGSPDSAIAAYREALSLLRRMGDARQLGATLNNYSIALMDVGELDSAFAYGEEALTIRRRLNDRQGEGYTLELLGSVLTRRGMPDSAIILFGQARTIAQDANQGLVEAQRLDNLGAAFEQLHQTDSALAYYLASRTTALTINDHPTEALALLHAGLVYATRGALTAARAYFDSAAAVSMSLTRRAGNDVSRSNYAELNTRLYAQWSLAWAAEPGNQSALRALGASERGRARSLLDLMRADVPASSPGADLGEETRTMLGQVLTPGSAMLVYLITPDTLLVWFATSPASVTLTRIPINQDSLAAIVRGFHGRIAGNSGRMVVERGETLESVGWTAGLTGSAADSAALARVLLPQELMSHLDQVRELVIIPSGTIGVVPFSALLSKPNIAVRYAPSLASLAQLVAGPRAAAGSRTLVIGNPSMPEVTIASGRRIQLLPLAGAGEEAQSIARRLKSVALIGPAGTETEVRRLMPEVRIVHLATHGYAYSTRNRARSSFVALAPDSANDGLLTVAEIMGDSTLNLRAELVVLSACETGLGDIRQAEGTIGLQRAFLARGAHSVLVSLWNVSDEATRLLMDQFYAHWLSDRDHPSKSESLRRAQDDVRQTRGFEHPRNWAAFQLVGAN